MNSLLESPSTITRPRNSFYVKKKILLMDDDAAIRQLLARLLTDEDYSVLAAADSVEALELAGATEFDLALLDLNKSLQDDGSTLEQMAARNPSMCMIIVAEHSNPIFSAPRSNKSVLMEKPLDLPNLFRTIRSLLENHD